ncbi:hypothetical protein O6H91_02G152900 [Diphasiastrum complanatum]|uniref:Uncharacterized protein n=2 Tax=Diphasiastrum complanatum TaxID=34168 RepID=A0ACC2EMD5_DIPCM|nr:hypothetical protein O6H91_Y345700 [Diphasiastrum complanatum]KAJ7567558.1 hypothetical protein O6H91_02G152900 [Diphasiastrum complanatum]KAJ7567560.1 hypothetical protein O6H91_02G152900 [Diphasiastrum complanatum]
MGNVQDKIYSKKEITNIEKLPCEPQLLHESNVIVLEDDEPNLDSASQPKTNNTMPLEDLSPETATQARRGRKARIILSYDSDSSKERTTTINSSKMIQNGVRGTGNGNAQQKITMPHFGQIFQSEHTNHKTDDMMNVLLLSDSDCENDEKGYIEEETMKFKESGYLQDTSSDAWGEKNDFLCPATSREKKKQRRKYSCTVCSKPLSKTKVTRHPLLRVCVCDCCKQSYKEVVFKKDEDGFEGACRWCGNGGDLVCCEQCDKVFCQECITKNFGEGELLRILDTDGDWLCFVCDPTILKPFLHRLLKAREDIYRSRFDE